LVAGKHIGRMGEALPKRRARMGSPRGTKDAYALVEDSMPERNIKQTDPDKRYRSIMGATTLVGDSVQNSVGEDLGKVKEIMIDVPTGRIAYAVLSFGGRLNMGNKLFAVPWGVLRLNEDAKKFILNVDKEHLKNAPGFDKDDWPDMADLTWQTDIFSYYGAEPYWEGQHREKTLRGGGGV
jgi:sporulation protein YlmC with PRC-barrel domain